MVPFKWSLTQQLNFLQQKNTIFSNLDYNIQLKKMNSFSLEANSENELPIIAKKLLEFAMDKKVFLFYGEMGTGKTTFIKCICNSKTKTFRIT